MTTTTAVYDVHETRRGVPVTVRDEVIYTEVKGGGCLSANGAFQILLGLAVIALEAACVHLCFALEESAVGIWVGIFAIITGIIGLVAGGQKSSTTKARRCIFITELLFTIICAIQAFAFFCASAALLATSVNDYHYMRNGNEFGGGSPWGGGYGGYGNNFRYGGFYGAPYGSAPYVCTSYNGYIWFAGSIETMIGLKAALMVLYVILFIVCIISSALSCVNCCRRSRKQQVVTIYPNGQPTVVKQHKV